ncbi:hypothetical protein [Vibrio sp. C8]
MAGLVEVSQWEDEIYQLETTDPVEGGPDGIDNRQAKQLANRTLYLKQQLDSASATGQLAEFNPTRIYKFGDICFTRDLETGAVSYWKWYSHVEQLAGKSPLSDTNRRIGWTDNTKPFYWLPYTPKIAGETMLWDTDTIPESMVVGIGQQLPAAVYHTLAAAKPEWVDAVDNTLINIPDRQGRFVRAADGTDWLAGEMHEDAIREIEGALKGYGNGSLIQVQSADPNSSFEGAIQPTTSVLGQPAFTESNVGLGINANSGIKLARGVKFNASNVVPTADENQPRAYIEWVGYAL